MAAFNYSGQSTYEVSFSNGDSWANEISVQNALPTSNIFTLPNYQIAYTDYNVATATNADTVDGYHASDFASSSHSHNYAANENYGGFTKSGRLPISGFYQSNESKSGDNAPWSDWMHLINC